MLFRDVMYTVWLIVKNSTASYFGLLILEMDVREKSWLLVFFIKGIRLLSDDFQSVIGRPDTLFQSFFCQELYFSVILYANDGS